MTPAPPARTGGPAPPPGDGAVSSVVSAILVFALLVTVSTLWTVTTLPQWVSDREEEHAHRVQASLAALQSGLESLSAAGDEGPSTVAVALRPRPVPLLQPVAASGSLGVGERVAASAEFVDEEILLVDGAPAGGEYEVPVPEGPGQHLAAIDELQSLGLRLTTFDVGNNDEAWVEVVATDGTGTVTARVVHAGKIGGSGPNAGGCLNSELRLEVTVAIPPAPPTTSVQALLCELANDLTGYSLDLGSAMYPVAEALDRLDTPYSLVLEDDATGGSAVSSAFYSIAFIDASGGQSVVGGGVPADYSLEVEGRRLVYEPGYREYSEQRLAWDLGGVVVEQPDGQAMAAAPSFDLVVEDGLGTLRWTFVELDAEGERSGSGQATARLRHVRTSEVVLSTAGATFTLDTPAAAAWRSFLATEALVAGAGASAAVGGDGDTATLTLSTGDVAEWRIHLRILHATLEVL